MLGGPVQLMTLPNAVVAPSSVALSRTAAGVAFHPLSTLAGKQGVYLLQQAAPGGTTMPTTVSLAAGVGVANAINKETGRIYYMVRFNVFWKRIEQWTGLSGYLLMLLLLNAIFEYPACTLIL